MFQDIKGMDNLRMIIAGGGTGGHINPAIAISNEVTSRHKNSEILFIGTKKGLESELVPKSGYNIKYVDVEGFLRMKSPRNFLVMGKFIKSICDCMGIIKSFKPDIVVGTGGYVSAPAVAADWSSGRFHTFLTLAQPPFFSLYHPHFHSARLHS